MVEQLQVRSLELGDALVQSFRVRLVAQPQLDHEASTVDMSPDQLVTRERREGALCGGWGGWRFVASGLARGVARGAARGATRGKGGGERSERGNQWAAAIEAEAADGADAKRDREQA